MKKILFFVGIISIFFLFLILDILIRDSPFSYRYRILENTTLCGIKSINDTNGINGNIIWAYTCNDSYIDSTKSGPSGTITIVNETDEKYWENETSRSKKPKNVWGTNSSLVLHFQNSTKDSSMNDLNSTILGNPVYTSSGIFGHAMSFDGSGDGILFDPDINLSYQPYWTVELWYYREGCSNDTRKHGEMFRTPYMRLADNYGTSKDLVLSFKKCLLPEDLRPNRGLPIVLHSGGEMKNNTWQYATIVCQDEMIFLYDNGVRVGSTKVSGPATTPYCNCSYYEFNKISIGLDYRDNVSYAWNGSIDEVRIWNRALSSKEILNNWNNGINNLTILGTEDTNLLNRILKYITQNTKAPDGI